MMRWGAKVIRYLCTLLYNIICITMTQKRNSFKDIETPDLLAIILRETKKGDEALYYLLSQRLKGALKSVYEKKKDLIDDSYEDTINEFYLYLHDRGRQDNNDEPYYQPLRKIKNKQAFSYWMINTYRFFLYNKLQQMIMTPLFDNLHEEQPYDSVKNWERKIWDMSVLITYAYQKMRPLTKYIFFRSMLRVMNKRLCVKNERMAQVLGISYIDYRVRNYHAWHLVRKKRKQILEGERIKLDKEGIEMAKHIYRSYGNLFPLLRMYYMEILESLPESVMIKAVLGAHERHAF